MIQIPIEIGDIILTGRFKNHKVVVKEISQDENGLPLVNGKGILKIRIEKLMQPKKQVEESVGTQSINFVGFKNGPDGKPFMYVESVDQDLNNDFKGSVIKFGYLDSKDRNPRKERGWYRINKSTIRHEKYGVIWKEGSIKLDIKQEINEMKRTIKEGGRPNIPIDVKIKKEDNRFWIQLKEDDTVVGSPQGYETKEMAELACNGRGFKLNNEEPELPENTEVPEPSKGKPIKFKKPEIVDVGEEKELKESLKKLIKEMLLETQNLPPYSPLFSINSKQTGKCTTSKKETFLGEIKALIKEQLKKKLAENSPELDAEIEEYAKLSDQIDRMKAELEQMEKRFETLDQKFRLLLETMAKELDETSKVYIRAKNILITIKKQGYDRTNKSYKDAYEFIRKKVNPKLQQMMDEVLETSKTISYVKSKLGVQYESKINENWISDLFNKVKNFFVSGIKKLRSLNQSVNQDLTRLEGML